VMEANRDWWGWSGKAPGVDRVVWKPIPDDFARLSALQRGEVDVITNVPPDQMKIVKTVTVPSTRIVSFQINGTQPPLSDKRARQALHYAMDIASIVKNLYAGQGKPLSGGLADTDFGYNPELKLYPYDPERAKKLLAEAGYPNGIDVTLYAGSGTMVNDKQLLEALADMWSKAGIRAKVEMMEMAQRQKMLNERTTRRTRCSSAIRSPRCSTRTAACGASCIRAASPGRTGWAASPATASTTSWSRRATRWTRKSARRCTRRRRASSTTRSLRSSCSRRSSSTA